EASGAPRRRAHAGRRRPADAGAPEYARDRTSPPLPRAPPNRPALASPGDARGHAGEPRPRAPPKRPALASRTRQAPRPRAREPADRSVKAPGAAADLTHTPARPGNCR